MVAEPSDPGDLSTGFELPGGFVIDEPAAQGRTRLIYAARSADGALVAVHLLDAGLVDGLGEWFTQGATARAEVAHPTLPKTLAVGHLADGRPFEVTEFLEGTSMREALDASPEGLDPLAVVHVVNEVAAALDALHTRTPPVVHRTLCPEHMVVLRDTHEVRLLGLFYADRPQFEGVRPGYRSPEELAGVLSLGPRADVFSLATVTYELLTGRAAWPQVPELALDSMRVGVRDRVSVLRPTLPTTLDAVFERAWSLSPDARHSSAGRFARALRAAVDPLDLAASLASNVFDDRPTAQVPTLSPRIRNNTLLNAGAVAQAIVPRAVVGTVRASEADEEARPSRPPPARPLRAPMPPGTRPVREAASEAPPKIALPRPEDLLAPDEPAAEPEATRTSATPEVTAPTDVARLMGDVEAETTGETALPGPGPDPAAITERPPAPAPPAPVPAPAAPSPPPPVVVTPAVVTPAVVTPAVVTPAVVTPVTAPPSVPPREAPLAPVAAPALPDPVSAPLPVDPSARRPDAFDARLFRDEPTAVLHTVPPAAPATPWARSPVALAGLFVAHAILIVGIAHAISYALVQRQAPSTQVIQGPSPVCAPCAACPAPAAPPMAVDAPVAPVQGGARAARPAQARAPARTQIIRSVPDFGRPR